jgi:RNA polymerase sigma-70 factor (ECF subfamily)
VAQTEELAQRFEQQRPQLRAVAYRVLGSVAEADDAVQETWLRLTRSDPSSVENLGGWLTTVVARVALNMLRARTSRRELPLDAHVPDPVVSFAEGPDPEQEALLADSVGLALLVVLETLTPAERVAFVLHDMFSVPFGEIARVVDRSPAAARQLASRARRRVRSAAPAATGAPDRGLQRRVVAAFRAAARAGDLDALVALLDPDVVLRVDRGAAGSRLIRGPERVAKQAARFRRAARFARPALVNGAAGLVAYAGRRPVAVLGFTLAGERIAAIDIVADRRRLRRLAIPTDAAPARLAAPTPAARAAARPPCP